MRGRKCPPRPAGCPRTRRCVWKSEWQPAHPRPPPACFIKSFSSSSSIFPPNEDEDEDENEDEKELKPPAPRACEKFHKIAIDTRPPPVITSGQIHCHCRRNYAEP